jgi:hypothetical protein
MSIVSNGLSTCEAECSEGKRGGDSRLTSESRPLPSILRSDSTRIWQSDAHLFGLSFARQVCRQRGTHTHYCLCPAYAGQWSRLPLRSAGCMAQQNLARHNRICPCGLLALAVHGFAVVEPEESVNGNEEREPGRARSHQMGLEQSLRSSSASSTSCTSERSTCVAVQVTGTNDSGRTVVTRYDARR